MSKESDRERNRENLQMLEISDHAHLMATYIREIAAKFEVNGVDPGGIPVLIEAGRRSAVRAGHRYLPRNRAVLVEPVRSNIRR